MRADFDAGTPMWFAPAVGTDPDETTGEPENLYRLIGARWVVAVLHELRGDTVRYNALHRRLGGVSHKMLTQTLRRLERADIVVRQAHPTVPPNVEYLLSSVGVELMDNLALLERWADANGLPH